MPPAKPITAEYLDSALENLRKTLHTDIVAELSTQIKELRDIVDKQNNTIITLNETIHKQREKIDCLSNTVVQQQTQLENIEKNNRADYVIIHGLPEDNTPIENHISNMISMANLDVSIIDRSFSPFRLGKSVRGKTRPLKVKLSNAKNSSLFMKSFAKLPKETKNKMYITPDQTPLAVKENSRLRNHLNELRDLAENKNKTVTIKRGELLIDSKVVDKFDIKNQIF